MNKKDIVKIGSSFEQEPDDIPNILEYYFSINGFSLEANPCHPDHLWTILDRIETEVMFSKEKDNMKINKNQRDFILHFISKWKKDIEPYCVKFESE